MKCFCHNDADGKCGGAIVLRKYPECEVRTIDYKDEFPIDDIEKDERVFIIDYSLPPDMMRRLMNRTMDIVWIDHHRTAIARYEGFDGIEDIASSVLDTSHSGCYLTWTAIYPDAPVPRSVKLIEDWDIWKHEFAPTNEHFILFLDSMDTHPMRAMDLWEEIFSDNIDDFIDRGKAIKGYVDNRNREFAEEFGFECRLEKFPRYRCFAMNAARCSSKGFASVDDGSYDIFVAFVYDGSKYSVSLYSTRVDVSEVATEYGGGGHKGAAGFQSTVIPVVV